MQTQYSISPLFIRDDEDDARRVASDAGNYPNFAAASKAASEMDRRYPVRNSYGWIVAISVDGGFTWI
jgi:hypothetical protein